MGRTRVMIAGLPGKMATLVAGAISAQDDMELHNHALSEKDGNVHIVSSSVVMLIPPFLHQELLKHGDFDLIVDFTLPKSVNRNAALYCELGIPFVMGTTGGDRQKLLDTVNDSGIPAVIGTNMAVPVVIFQSMIDFAAANFGGSLNGFTLVIEESHQAQKQDPSGTAVSLLESFAALGMPLQKEQIVMIRDPMIQETKLSIPRQYLGGHGYHTYTLISADGTVLLRFTHNILGRSVYVDGALKAIRFLANHKDEKGRVFSMTDVLRG